ncbi:MAG: M1 family metallopeptidase, partial [Ginsengibacter sp.]
MKDFLVKNLLLLLFIFYGINAFSQNNTTYFQQKADFKIEVSLNDVNNTLDGFEVIHYTNNSPDTLQYIWFHLWPNAYKNDQTAFSEQLLQLGRTDFYFSNEEKRGYINRLDFKVNNVSANLEDHPQFIDVVKLVLPSPLVPGKTIQITTPFHVKIPFNFSRGGFVDGTYQITQWYPKPAVYDKEGWHPMPYLDQGEFFSEFGDYEVKITLPQKYKVAATGEEIPKTEPSNNRTKTLQFVQKNVHDFAWFADKNFIEKKDTLQLPSGRIINVAAYYTPDGKEVWKKSISFLKDAVRTRSKWLGEYPYQTVTAVEAKMGFSGGMEYPTITSIAPMSEEKELEMTIEHEVGHNWNYGILASNERDHPWMDEGINTYFDNRYSALKFGKEENTTSKNFIQRQIPNDLTDISYRTLISEKLDQPIETKSEDFSEMNYGLTAYYKTGLWMKELENYIGKDLFDKCLHGYYDQWKFKHPYPADFKKVVEEVSGKNVDSIFSLLNKKGAIEIFPKKQFKLAPIFSFKETDKYKYLFISPAVGYNFYDKIMVGGLIHNYTLPLPRFHFFVAPMYATGSKTLTGMGRVGYDITSYGLIRKAEISLSGAKFTRNDFVDSTGTKNYLGVTKLVPSIRLTFKNKNANSSITKYIQWKTYFIEETNYLFTRDTVQQIYVISYPKIKRILNQLTLSIENSRALYPYSAKLVAEQSKGFLRLAFDGNYYFNYASGGGLQARLFAGKFIYLGSKNLSLSRYYLNMTGANGDEDYTYSNYFVGRNEFEKAPSQQIMIKDGGFKVRTDLLYNKIGKTDDWLTSLNLKTDIPNKLNPLQVLPFKIPLKLFLDVGTYADAWQKNAPTGKFIYDAGLQISLFHDIVNIYMPLLYSKVYSDYFK